MTKNGLEVNSDNNAANFCAGRPRSESHCQFSQSGFFFCGFYRQGPANLGENKKSLNTDRTYLLREHKLFSLQFSCISCA